MPNWSDTKIVFRGDKEKVKEVYEHVKKHGYDFGQWRMPKELKVYTSPIKIVDKDEWKKVAKEARKKKQSADGLTPLGFSVIKDSVVKRILKKRVRTMTDEEIEKIIVAGKNSPIDWYHWNVNVIGTKWNLNIQESKIEMSDLGDGKAELLIETASPWSGPSRWIFRVADNYGLDVEYVDYEPGNDFFIRIVIYRDEEGKMVAEKEEGAFLSAVSVKHLGIDYFIDYFEDWIFEDRESARKEFERVAKEFEDNGDSDMAEKVRSAFESAMEGHIER